MFLSLNKLLVAEMDMWRPGGKTGMWGEQGPDHGDP